MTLCDGGGVLRLLVFMCGPLDRPNTRALDLPTDKSKRFTGHRPAARREDVKYRTVGSDLPRSQRTVIVARAGALYERCIPIARESLSSDHVGLG